MVGRLGRAAQIYGGQSPSGISWLAASAAGVAGQAWDYVTDAAAVARAYGASAAGRTLAISVTVALTGWLWFIRLGA